MLEIVEAYLVDKRTNQIDWSRASNALRSLWDHGQFNQKVPVTWVVIPNINYDSMKPLDPARGKPFASIHMEKGQEREDTFLRESGFEEFPILVSRWDVTGDDWYGTDCPGMVALGDVKQLQTGEKRSMQAVEKMLNPPLQGPTHIRNQKVSLLPRRHHIHRCPRGAEGAHADPRDEPADRQDGDEAGGVPCQDQARVL